MKSKARRRDFLRASVAGTTGLMAAVMTPRRVDSAQTAWADGFRINSDIDNLRVVCCHDPNMVTGNPASGISRQNSVVDAAVVQANMDEMAKALAQSPTAAEAWSTIFRKPDGKKWSGVNVAIKVNGVGSANNPRLSVIDKVCKVLNGRGVPFGNMVIYDGCHNALGLYDAFVGTELPTGVKVSDKNSLLGGTQNVSIHGDLRACTRHIADGTIDILVNIAVNKGHNQPALGATTLTMKNHYGTFDPSNEHSSIDYIIAINKHDAIIGGNPARQQLCILDSLWASNAPTPWAVPDHAPFRLVMGTFSPAIDYLTVKKIRIPIQGASHNDPVIARYITDFGYDESELSDFVDVTPASQADTSSGRTIKTDRTITIEVAFSPPGGLAYASTKVVVSDPCGLIGATVRDCRGRCVRCVHPLRSANGGGRYRLVWDGCTDDGRMVSAGSYIMTLEGTRGPQQSVSIVARNR